MAEVILADIDGCGIYQIRNLRNGKRYIGSAKSFRVRWGKHLSDLRNGCHHSVYLQRSWSIHGAESFEFEVLEICEPKDLIPIEQSWLDREVPEYNVCQTAGNCAGVRQSEETKQKRAMKLRGRKNPEAAAKRTGMKRTPEQRARFSAAQRLFYDSLSPAEKKSRAERIAKVNREKLRGRKRDPAASEKAAAKLRGKKRPKEIGEKISLVLSGRKLSPKHRQKLKEAWARRRANNE